MTGFKVVEVLLHDKGRYFSKSANHYVDVQELKELDNTFIEERRPELLNSDYKDFARYYAKEEIKGLDVLCYSEKIDELLKQGYQYLDRERFCLLVIDENRKVKNLVEVSLGAIDRTLADTSIIVKTLLNEDAKGVIFFHNHPSGNTKPSEEDIKVSTQLVKACNQIDIEVYASKVVGKEGVTDFEPNYDLYENSLYTTQEIMMTYKSLALDR